VLTRTGPVLSQITNKMHNALTIYIPGFGKG
jgi:hypothetical protein